MSWNLGGIGWLVHLGAVAAAESGPAGAYFGHGVPRSGSCPTVVAVPWR